MRRGEVWWADLPPPVGRRPVVLLSRNEAYPLRSFVTVAPVTSRARHLMAEVPLGPEDGLEYPCVANLDVVNTVPKSSLKYRMTTHSSEKLRAVEAAIHFALGMED